MPPSPSQDVQVFGLDGLVRQVNDPELLGRPLKEMFTRLTRMGEETAHDRARSSTVGASLHSEASSSMGRVYSTLPMPKAAVLEGGRRPGAKMPPLDVIGRWAGNRQAAFPIARAIARRGIKGRFFMRAARAQIRSAIPKELADVARAVARAWGRGF